MNQGKNIGHYNILKPLGKGGMGEVYLAEDTKLKRQVALKFLPESMKNDSERLARFRREALAAASLKHNNIATIYALEDIDDVTFIVMEYVEGETLTEQIPDEGMELGDFFNIFIPLADGLAHAHSQGRIHRDLKPANIMIAADGTPKILDFGLARIIDPNPVQGAYESEIAQDIESQAPTMTMKSEDQGILNLTRGGQLAGTPMYMSPEQAEREETDARTDIFSLGVVMYEALTGVRPFEGKTLESIIGRIVEAEPKAVTEIRPLMPYTLWLTIRRCLKKKRGKRTQTAEELHTELLDVQQDVQTGTVLVDVSQATHHVPDSTFPLRPVTTLALALILTLCVASFTWFLKPVPIIPELPLIKFTYPLDVVEFQAYRGPAISPDGTMIAYSQGTRSGKRLWIRDLDTVTPRELPDTEGAQRPFWSPNSDYVAYFEDNNTLRKVAASGGPSIPLCDLPGSNALVSRGGVWKPDGDIIFGVADGGLFDHAGVLYTVSSRGGDPTLFATADSSLNQRGLIYPNRLPDEARLLYAATVDDEAGALVVRQDGKPRVILPNPGERLAFPIYSPTGHIVYQRGFPDSKGVWAVPFDAGSMEVTGNPFLVDAEGGYPTLSSDGTLVYRSASIDGIAPPGQLVWVNRKGQIVPVGSVWQGLAVSSLSPDGRQVAFGAISQSNIDIRLYDMERNTSVRLTFDPGEDRSPVWSPDGRFMVFRSTRSGQRDIYIKSTDSNGEARLLVGGDSEDLPRAWSQDGHYLIYENLSDSTQVDIWYAMLQEGDTVTLNGPPQPFLQSQFNEMAGQLSPDGKTLAYVSDETGQFEVYICTFPGGRNRWQVSSNGGTFPRWHGNELFYLSGRAMMAVRVKAGNMSRPARAGKLFDLPDGVIERTFDISSDGQRFMMVQHLPQSQTTMTVVQNWFEELETQK